MSISRWFTMAAIAWTLPLALSACNSKCCPRRSAPPLAPPTAGAPSGGCVRPPGPSVPFDPTTPPPVPTPPGSAPSGSTPPAPTSSATAGAPVKAPVAEPVVDAPAAPASEKPVNMFCPVMMGEPIDTKITTLWDGKLVGFCSEVSKQKFLKNPAKYAKNLP